MLPTAAGFSHQRCRRADESNELFTSAAMFLLGEGRQIFKERL